MSSKRVSSIRQPTKSDLRVFHELLIMYFEKHPDRIAELVSNNFTPGTQDRIYTKFLKVAKPARGILSSTMFSSYTKLWRNIHVPKEEYLGILKNYCADYYVCFGGFQPDPALVKKEPIENEEKIVYPDKPTMPDNIRKPRVGIFIEPAMRGYYAESYKFHLLNYEETEVQKTDKLCIEKLILDNGGVVLNEEVLDEAQNRDTYIINFGRINDVVIQFLHKHQQDVYYPSLITNAYGKGSFSPDEVHICVDRLRFILKSQDNLHPEIENKHPAKSTNKSTLTLKVQTCEQGTMPMDTPPTNSISCNTELDGKEFGNMVLVQRNIFGLEFKFRVSSDESVLSLCFATWSDVATSKRAWLLHYLYKNTWTEKNELNFDAFNLAIQADNNTLCCLYKTTWERKRDLKRIFDSKTIPVLADIRKSLQYLTDEFLTQLKNLVMTDGST